MANKPFSPDYDDECQLISDEIALRLSRIKNVNNLTDLRADS